MIVEVSVSSRKEDLDRKKIEYEKLGIKEYIVLTCEDDEPKDVIWFAMKDDKYEKLEPTNGVFTSKHHSGLVLCKDAALQLDVALSEKTLWDANRDASSHPDLRFRDKMDALEKKHAKEMDQRDSEMKKMSDELEALKKQVRQK